MRGGEDGRMGSCLDLPFGILELWRTFISFLESLSLCWLEGGRRVRKGGGVFYSFCPGVWVGLKIILV